MDTDKLFVHMLASYVAWFSVCFHAFAIYCDLFQNSVFTAVECEVYCRSKVECNLKNSFSI
jgi:hypothetical protein